MLNIFSIYVDNRDFEVYDDIMPVVAFGLVCDFLFLNCNNFFF